MKIICFKNLSNVEILTRDELKKISGGDSGSGGNCSDQCGGEKGSCPGTQLCQSASCRETGGAFMACFAASLFCEIIIIKYTEFF